MTQVLFYKPNSKTLGLPIPKVQIKHILDIAQL
jgi:hypothetical protein